MAVNYANVSPVIQLPQSNVPVQPQIREYSIKLAKNNGKKHSVMRFNKELKVDFKAWKNAKLERESYLKENNNNYEEEMPKFGTGSEFGREARDLARNKKFGMKSKKCNSENRPWILKTNGEKAKKFKGIREGGISANAAYYVFKQAHDGSIEAFPLHEWYNFQPIQRYKALSAEEAEEEFLRRDKTLNYFNVMMRKRLRIEEEDSNEADMLDGDQKSKKKDKDLKISEMDEWMESDEESSDEEENCKKKSDDKDCDKKKKDGKKKKNKKKVADDEAFEESDDGDEEGRECDYISDSSASEDELELQKQIKSIDEERGLRKLLVSEDEDEEDDEGKKEDKGKIDEKKESTEADAKNSKENKDVDSDSSSSSKSGIKKDKIKLKSDSLKRSLATSLNLPKAKKIKLSKDHVSAALPLTSCIISGSTESGVTEAAVRRYLLRKPMTVTDLLLKFKFKKTGLDSEQIGVILTDILMKMNPFSQMINGKMYYSVTA